MAGKNGFTIFEVIMALFILTVAIGASVALITQTLVLVSVNESRAVASYLTQEGLEVVRNIRDSNWLLQRTNPVVSWKEGLAPGDYEVGYSDTSLAAYADRYLLLDTANGFYSYAPGGLQTQFKRKISITDIDADTIEVTSLVSWEERGRSHEVKAVERFYNWYGY